MLILKEAAILVMFSISVTLVNLAKEFTASSFLPLPPPSMCSEEEEPRRKPESYMQVSWAHPWIFRYPCCPHNYH